MKYLDGLIKKHIKKKVEHFSCTACDFKTTSSQGLKTHTKRKHTQLNAEKYPKTVNFVEQN